MNPDTPYTLAISHNELVAIIKWHCNQSRALPKKVGLISMKMAAESPLPRTRDMRALHDQAKEVLNYHSSRAKGLLSLLPPTKKG